MNIPNPEADFADALEKLAREWRSNGALVMSRTADWVRVSLPPSSTRPEMGEDGDPDPKDYMRTDDLLDREDEQRANAYHGEATSLRSRMFADARRLSFITALARPPAPRPIDGKEMLAAQVIAAGLCVSCFRFDCTNKEREIDKATGKPYYAECCRKCGSFKHEHGIYPPLVLLEAWHSRYKNWTEPMVRQALDDAARPKVKTA